MTAISDLVGKIRAAWFGRQLAASFATKPNRKYAPGSTETGPEAAEKYRNRRKYHAGHGSSLRKLQREFRIEAGERPLKFDVLGPREAKIVARAAKRAATGTMPAPRPIPDVVKAFFGGVAKKTEADALKGTNLKPEVATFQTSLPA